MSTSEIKPLESLRLPASVVSKTDLSRLVREFEQIDNELSAAAIREKTGLPKNIQPSMSDRLTEFLEQNEYSLDNPLFRSQLAKQLRQLKEVVPLLHMTFAVEADRESLVRLTEWLRQTIHPQAVLAVGVQPALVAGAYIRTPNHVHDMSLRHALDGQHELLIKELETLRGRN